MMVKIAGRRCLLVGAGRIAADKARVLLSHKARVVVVSPQATGWIRRQASAGALVWRRRKFSPRDVEGAFLVVAATNSDKINRAAFRACVARGILCNAVDDPEYCDFFYPAVVRRGRLQIAISTDGQSPALAARLRRDLERQFGPEWAAWVEHVGELRREILRRKMSPEQRRKRLMQIASQRAFNEFVQEASGDGKG
jgi:precorrin-2 dehydrogenase/sirohydrochlorin ferrochelatase